MAENRCNEMMSSSSSPSTTTASSSPMIDTNHTSINSNDSKTMNGNRNTFNAPKYGTPVPNRVFVGGIPTDTSEAEVRQLFAKFGTIVSVKIINDRAGVPRGYGFVTFESEEDAKRVMKESDNLLIKNRKLNVSVAVKRQQHYSNDMSSRVVTNGSHLYYNPYALMNATSNSLYPDFGIYTSEGIPIYNLGISPQLVANSGLSSATQSPYPYTYHTSGLYLTTQPSLAPQLAPQFQSSPQSSAYPLVSTSYRLPLNSQNVSQNLNVSQMNPYLQLSNATTPPLSQSSSIQYGGSVANQMVGTDCGHSMGRAVNTGLSPLSLYSQPSIYAISSNIANSTQPMACVQNVQLKADNAMNLCSDNSPLLSGHQPVVSSQQMVELLPVWPQRVPNIQSPPNNTALNGYQYSSKSMQNNSTTTTTTTAAADTTGAKDNRPDRRNNSSYNTSHYRKAVNNSNQNRSTKQSNQSYGQNRNQNYGNGADNECQTMAAHKHDYASGAVAAHHHSQTPNTSALQGLPFVKHYSNNRFHTLPVSQSMLNSYSPPSGPPPKHNSVGGQPMVTKMVNGVQIYVPVNYSAGDCGPVDGYGYSTGNPLTPPLTPGTTHHNNAVKAVHK